MTITELLVVIAIIGLVVSMSLVAVLHARESSRRLTCSSNLRQIGLAAANYESQYRCLPHGAVRGYGYGVAILGFLEQSNLPDLVDVRVDPDENWELSGIELPVWRCPSESAPRAIAIGASTNKWAATNYFGNFGTWLPLNGMDGVFRYDDGSHDGNRHGGPVSYADITGGLSHTSLIAEAKSGDVVGGRLAVAWNLPRRFSAGEIDAFSTYCDSLPADPKQAGWRGDANRRGLPWTRGNMAITLFNHVSTPNQPSCLNLTSLSDAASTASSSHPRGVNVVACDGHVSFIANSIDRSAWRAMGSRGQDSN